ncbi:hypothetical protein Patl1_34951 [Pistacia atlantica]|uniref:Uncharacterized protein n=1 Tax=Pistacia atlantica TaxID=434234 RepID=A0ACC0ZTX4_9ROSI|nr:hypothetical protein Patl1_34951 [Pistacia atlantica]
MIGAACESAEKVLADTRKAYILGTRQGPQNLPSLDKSQAAKIQEQENLLRAAVNNGEGLRMLGDQRQMTPALPVHLVDLLSTGDGVHNISDTSGMYMKGTPPLSSNNIISQGNLLQVTYWLSLGCSLVEHIGFLFEFYLQLHALILLWHASLCQTIVY